MHRRPVPGILMIFALAGLAGAQPSAMPAALPGLRTPELPDPLKCRICFSDEDCQWCGFNCYNPKRCPKLFCPAVMPPEDRKCVCMKIDGYPGSKVCPAFSSPVYGSFFSFQEARKI